MPAWSSQPGLSWHYGKIISGLSTMRVFHFEMSPFHKLLFFYVCKEHVLAVFNLLSSLDRCHATTVLLSGGMSHASVAWFCC